MSTRRTTAAGRRALGLVVCCVAGCLASAVAADLASGVSLRSDHFSLVIPADEDRLGRNLLDMAEEARRVVLGRMPQPLEERVILVWCSTEREFYEHVRGLGHALAAAVPSRLRIYLNGPEVRRIEPRKIQHALVHEYVHIYLGRRIRRAIPLWLNEGLAMIVSEDWGFGDSTALAADGLFGAVYTPEELADSFPTEPSAQRRAYRQSRSMTAFLAEMRFAESGVGGLVADLSRPSGRSRLAPLLYDRAWLADFYARWRRQKVRPGQLTLFVTSSGTLWIALTFFLLYAYRRKRRAKKQREARWAWEEEWGYHDDGFDD